MHGYEGSAKTCQQVSREAGLAAALGQIGWDEALNAATVSIKDRAGRRRAQGLRVCPCTVLALAEG